MGSKKASVVGTAPLLTAQQQGLQNQQIGQSGSALGNMNLDLNQNSAYQSALNSANSFTGEFPEQDYMQRFQRGVYEPAIRNFEQRTRPDLVSMGMFGSGARNSSTLDQALATAQKDLSLDLASLAQQNQAQGYENYSNRRLQGASLQGQLSQLPLSALLPFLQSSYTTAQSPLVDHGQQGYGPQIFSNALKFGAGALAGPSLGFSRLAGGALGIFS